MKRFRQISADPVSRAISLGAMLVALLVTGCGGPAPEPKSDAVPIVLYLVDTLRADRLGMYGYTERETSRNLDRLAAESVVFDAAYAAAPWTLPSVASIITSTYSCEHGLLDGRKKLSSEIPTLAELLAELDEASEEFERRLGSAEREREGDPVATA